MKSKEIRKNISLSSATWAEVADIRFSHRFKSELDALRVIVDRGVASFKRKGRRAE